MTSIPSIATNESEAFAPAVAPLPVPKVRRAPRTRHQERSEPQVEAYEADRERARRVVNVVVACVGLVLTAPLMLVVAALVKLTSRGPVFYTQTRIGLDRRDSKIRAVHQKRGQDQGGRPFKIYKFRTMRPIVAGADSQIWASPTDPRVTPLGRILRKYRIDELPQLFNVLRGDMNVVGPRPEQPGIFADLRTQVHAYHLRQRVRPGITGWAQINQHYDSCIDDVRRKVALDLQYIQRQSLAHDLRIMVSTVPVIAFRKGAW